MKLRLAIRVAGGALVAGLVAAIAPVPRGPVVAGFFVFLAALLAAELVGVVARRRAGGSDSLFERAVARRPPGPRRPEDLVRLEDQIALALGAALDVYVRLRPLLREAAAERLRTRHGIDLDRDPARARSLLGDEAWALLRPDLEPPADRFGPGISQARLGRVLDAVEAL